MIILSVIFSLKKSGKMRKSPNTTGQDINTCQSTSKNSIIYQFPLKQNQTIHQKQEKSKYVKFVKFCYAGDQFEATHLRSL